MQNKRYSNHWAQLRILTILCFCFVILLSAVSVSRGQSGRKPPKQPTSPDPLPPKQEEPPIAKPSSKDQNAVPEIPITVAWYLQNMNTSSIYARVVEDGVLERLSQSNSVKPSASKELNRKEAMDIAKRSTDTYVLWFQLDVDMVDSDRAGLGNVPPQYLYVRYEIFTPGTGKTKTSGNVYQRPRGAGGLPLPMPRTSASAEYLLRNCGREMADRLFDILSVRRPVDRN